MRTNRSGDEVEGHTHAIIPLTSDLKGLRSMAIAPRRLTLNSSSSGDFRSARTRRLGGVVVKPSNIPVILEIVLIETGVVVKNAIRSWEIGDGNSVAIVLVKDTGQASGPLLRLLA